MRRAIDSHYRCGYPRQVLKSRGMFIRKSIYSVAIVALLLATATAAFADVYAYKDRNGVMTFTNVPTHGGFRRVLRDLKRPMASAAFKPSYDALIRTASDRYSIDADLIRAVIKTESDFDATARSRKGAMGLMQLMPDTARFHNVGDAYNPEENVEGGVRHLRMLLDRYRGDLELSLAAYNAGSGAVEKHQGIPPFSETREYVRRVLHFYSSYRGEALQISSPVRQ